jgi:hypothetical protein
MGDAAWQRTADAVRATFDGGTPLDLEPLLAPDVRWHGVGPGGCHSAADVVAELRAMEASGATFRLVELRRVAHRILLHVVVEPEGREVHQVVTLDASARIRTIMEYGDPAVAVADLAPPAPGGTAGEVGRVVAFVDVRDVTASVAFYGLLGFAMGGEHHTADGRLVWAALHSGAAELMLNETDEPVDAAAQGVLFYLFSDDLPGLREHLRAHGAVPSEIADGSPGPSAEMRVDDPDGYCLMIAASQGT